MTQPSGSQQLAALHRTMGHGEPEAIGGPIVFDRFCDGGSHRYGTERGIHGIAVKAAMAMMY